jgi:bifunctional UDP-N-acetylglucosamine pyrophosphorylase/glucosamine-1-phosphate N-acetyltransferase
VQSASGVPVDKTSDGTVVVSKPAAKDTVTVSLPAPESLAALRLEALPHESLPGGGPGHAGGNFVVTGIRVAVKPPGEAKPPMGRYVRIELPGEGRLLQLAEVEAHLRAARARALMLDGATLVDPARVDVRGRVTLGRDVTIDVNVIFEGEVRLGDRVRIGAGCVLRDVDIGADTVVHPNCVLEQAKVGPQCQIGPFGRLRPGAALGRDVHIGNFVEVKNSQLADGAKANHLAYVGDATVGARVNIGAGTITANYDGVQ